MSTKPQRIQLSRKKGWRLPAGAVKVDRSTPFGNPVRATHDVTAAEAVDHFRCWLETSLPGQEIAERARRELRGKDLACWCKLPADGEPDHCHAAELLRIANA